MKPKIIILSILILIFAVSDALAYNSGNAAGWSWAEEFGWINFSGKNTIVPYGIQVSNDQITGYVWSEKTGWISLNCLNKLSCGTVPYGVVSDGSGNLSGYAWSEKGGWINFEGLGSVAYQVKIDGSGNFSGYAWSEQLGWINTSDVSSGYGVTESGYPPSVTAGAPHTINTSASAGLDSGLVGYWSFDGPTISGTTVKDLSGQNNNGTNNGATPTLGARGQALSFNGTSSYASIGNTNKSIESVAFWVKPSSTSQYIIDLDGGTHYIRINSGVVTATGFSSPTIYVDGTSTTIFPNTKWHQITVTTSSSITASNVTLGKEASNYFSGSLDEVRLYNRILSTQEVSDLYHLGGQTIGAPQAATGSTSGLVGHWTFDGPTISGTTIADTSGNGNNGTNNGAAPTLGKLGQALSFNGTSSYVSLSGTISTVNSVSFWVKPSSTTQYAIDLDGGTHYIWINAGTVTAAGFSSPTIYVDGAATSTFPNTNWHHVTITTTSSFSTSSATIGKHGSNYFSGKIDDVRVYNRVLSATEVSDLYKAGNVSLNH